VTRADFVKTFGGVILGWILGFSSALGVQRWTEAKQVRNLARLLEVELEHNIRFLSMYAKIDPTTIVDQGQSIPLDRTMFPEGSEFRTGVFSATLNGQGSLPKEVLAPLQEFSWRIGQIDRLRRNASNESLPGPSRADFAKDVFEHARGAKQSVETSDLLRLVRREAERTLVLSVFGF